MNTSYSDIKLYDLITHVNGVQIGPLDTQSTFAREISKVNIGTNVDLTYQRPIVLPNANGVYTVSRTIANRLKTPGANFYPSKTITVNLNYLANNKVDSIKQDKKIIKLGCGCN